MRRIIISLICLAATITALAQDTTPMISVYRNDGEFSAFIKADVDSISFAEVDGTLVQVMHAKDSVYYIPVSSVVSINFDNDSLMHPHMVDLGLPSGTKWASCNIGATSPEGYGKYFAWAMTEELESYEPNNYIYYDPKTGWADEMGRDIAGTKYDVAHVRWGGNWQMPSFNQGKELIDNCTGEWTSENGVDGMLFTGPNGNTIFMPAAGYYFADEFKNGGEYGSYWTDAHYIYYQGYALHILLQ